MAEYIDREVVLKRFEVMKAYGVSLKDAVYLDGVMAVIDALPAADVAPVVHGEWMRHSNKLWCYCSVCLEDALMSRSTGAEVLSETCPNCGAKMDGETTT